MIETFLSAGLSAREYIPSRIGAAAGAAKRGQAGGGCTLTFRSVWPPIPLASQLACLRYSSEAAKLADQFWKLAEQVAA
jgi:hypothetical protein